MSMSVDELRGLAGSLLPSELASRWSSMVQPAVRLAAWAARRSLPRHSWWHGSTSG